MALGSILLTGVMTTFLHLSRGGLGMSHYADMESQARRTLHQFGQDCRQATNAVWTDANTLSLTVNGATIVYQFDTQADTFTRTQGGSNRVLSDNVSNFSFRAYNINSTELDLANSPGSAGATTKMIQVDLNLTAGSESAVSASQQVISARYVLRNKKVS